MHEKSASLAVTSQEFMTFMKESGSDPHEALIFMQTTFECDLGEKVGFMRGIVSRDPDAVRASSLTLEQYEAVKGLAELTTLFCTYGILSPRQVGLWLSEPSPRLDDMSPLDRLFIRLDENGFKRQDIKRVIGVADTFLRPTRGCVEAIQNILAGAP